MKFTGNYLSVISIIIFSLAVYPQQKSFYTPGRPFINNFHPKEYRSHNQCWAAVRDNRGVLYVGNSAGLLEYDGYIWNKIEVDHEVVFALDSDSGGVVYAGSVDDIGFIDKSGNGTPKYKSLLAATGIKEPIGQVWTVKALGNKAVFISTKYLVVISGAGKRENIKTEIYRPKGQFVLGSVIGNALYVQDKGAGILKYENGKLSTVPGSQMFNKETVLQILPYDVKGSLLVGLRSSEYFLYDGSRFTPFPTQIKKLVPGANISRSALPVPGGKFAISTFSSGIIVMDRNGNVTGRYNRENGLIDDNILGLYYSKGKMWAATQNGISAIDIGSPFSVFNQESGLFGSISDFLIHGDKYYAATGRGVSVASSLNQLSPPRFKELAPVFSEVWDLEVYKNIALAAGSNGVFRLDGPEPRRIPASWDAAYYILPSKFFPGRIYVALDNGVAVLEESGGKFTDLGIISAINTPVRHLAEDASGNLLAGTVLQGLLKVTGLNNGSVKSAQAVRAPLPGNGNTPALVRDAGEHLFFRAPGQNIFVDKNLKVVNSGICGEMTRIMAGKDPHAFIMDSRGNFWFSALSDDGGDIFCARKEQNGYITGNVTNLKTVIDLTNPNSMINIAEDTKRGTLWFVGADNIVSLDLASLDSAPGRENINNCMIRRVVVGGDSLLYAGDDLLRTKYNVDSKLFGGFPYRNNSIRFKYSSMNFDNGLSLYQHKLDGYEDDWSGWTADTRKDYTNLPPGDYVFRVRAKNINNYTGRASTFTFSIATPWYMAWYMYIIYAGLIAFFFITLDKIRWRYLENKNQRLEAIINERTRKISEQAAELQRSNAEKDKFFSIISHDLRSPFHGLLGFSQALAEDYDRISEVDRKFYIRTIEQLTGSTYKLLDNLLDWARLESGKMSFNPEPLSLDRELKATIELQKQIALNKNIVVEDLITAPIAVKADKNMLQTVVRNLLTNAIKYTEKGGKVTISSGREDDYVSVTVADTGIGIQKENLEKLFRIDVNFSTKGTAGEDGTGLGLVMCRDMVVKNGGIIKVESAPGKGSSFTFTLPAGA